jgi:hypothetical protein
MSPIQDFVNRSAENMERMDIMNLTDPEAQIIAGFLAGSEEMSAALDIVMSHRER